MSRINSTKNKKKNNYKIDVELANTHERMRTAVRATILANIVETSNNNSKYFSISFTL